MGRPLAVTLLLPMLVSACTTFGSVRSAVVDPGPSLAMQASFSTPAGDGASRFWTLECGASCSREIPGAELGFMVGWRPARERSPAFALGAGLNGVFFPYAD